VLLRDQDRSQWDRDAITDATQLLARAASHHRPGPYQLQAAILACHADAPTWDDTDWTQIVVLYDMLLHQSPSPIIRMHRAIALRYVSGPAVALDELDALAPALERHHLYHAARAELLRELGHPQQARLADQRALDLATNPAQRAILQQRIHQLDQADPRDRAGAMLDTDVVGPLVDLGRERPAST
jgi:predicted RNA polymerase sigma factor